MKKSPLTIGCQTLLRESETQTVPWSSTESFTDTGTPIEAHFSLRDGFVSWEDVVTASCKDILQRNPENPLDSDEMSSDSIYSTLREHALSRYASFKQAGAIRRIAQAQMNFMHKLDLKRHALHGQQQRAADLNDRSTNALARRRSSELDAFSRTVNEMGLQKQPTFHGNGDAHASYRRPLERNSLARKLDLVQSALNSLNTVTKSTHA